MSLSNSQKEILDSLIATASVFFSGEWADFPVRPRFSRFITGPTGTGKSFLVRRLASELAIPVLELAASSWLPVGASDRAVRSTWIDIRDFVYRNSRGILFVDEFDKVTGGSTWMQYIRVEMFSLLDRRLPDPRATQTRAGFLDCEEPQEDVVDLIKTRLDQSMMIVGAGAFQDLREGQQQRIGGFGNTESPPGELNRNQMSKVIPREIVNRFAGPILSLPPLQREDYWEILSNVCKSVPPGLASSLKKLGEGSIEDAVESEIGYRWIEELLLQAMVENGEFTYTNSRHHGPEPC